jgi:tripartite-type tricarboxylate transporter receptor subunit TctC
MLRLAVSLMLTAAMALSVTAARAQNFPNKPIRILTTEAGGASDFGARLIGQGITGSLGQPIVIENKGGGSGVLAGETLAKASPDGYTLLYYGSVIWMMPLLRSHVPYDPVKDFAPVSLTDSQPIVLVVPSTSQVKAVADLIALAKAKPGQLNYARAAAGGPSHLAAEMFKSLAGLNIVAVPFKGGGPALIGLMGNQAEMMFTAPGTAMSQIKAGRLRALAVTSEQPSTLFPGVPTVAASLPGFQYALNSGMFAPAGTPRPVIERLNRDIVQFLHGQEAKEKFRNTAVEVVGSPPGQLAATMKSEMTTLGKVIKDLGIHDD